jgi:hypothetical protein
MYNVVSLKMSSVLSLLQVVEILNQFDFHLYYTGNCISAFYTGELQRNLPYKQSMHQDIHESAFSLLPI